MRTHTFKASEDLRPQFELLKTRADKLNDRLYGFVYEENLTGPNGMDFCFYVPEEMPTDRRTKLIRMLRSERDVNNITFIKIPPTWDQ